MEMAQYIIGILRTQLTVIFSWGFCNPIAINNGVYFTVHGFKHQGWVLVKYNEGADLFDVELYDIYQTKIKSIADVYAEDLVEVIDNAVERTDDYKIRIKETYNLQ